MTVMNDIPRQKLCEIIDQHGRPISEHPQQCHGFLLDACGEYRREISVLVSAAKEGVPQELLSSKGVPEAILVDRLTNKLQADLALDKTAARWAVDSWGLALGVISPRTRSQQPENPTTPLFQSSVFPTAAPSNPSASSATFTSASSASPAPSAPFAASAPSANPASSMPPPLSSSPSVPAAAVPHNSQSWSQAIAIGSLTGALIVGGFLSMKPFLESIVPPIVMETPTAVLPSNSPTPSKPPTLPSASPSASPSAFPSISPSISPPPVVLPVTPIDPVPIPQTPASITQREAVGLIETWLDAKQEIFASPYSYQSVKALTTGPLYADLTKADGPIEWLKKNGAYYRYGVQRVESVEKLSSQGNKASIEVWVTEERTLYKKDGTIDPNESDLTTSLVRYSLERVQGQWKIADYRVQKTP